MPPPWRTHPDEPTDPIEAHLEGVAALDDHVKMNEDFLRERVLPYVRNLENPHARADVFDAFARQFRLLAKDMDKAADANRAAARPDDPPMR